MTEDNQVDVAMEVEKQTVSELDSGRQLAQQLVS